MKELLTLILWINLWVTALACDCKVINNLGEAQKSDYMLSDLIFVGAVVAINSDGSYSIKITELLKGETEDSVVVGGKLIDYCSDFPYGMNEIWLIYTNRHQDGTINIPMCGLSRSYRYPFYVGSDYQPPPPPRNATTADLLDYEMKNLELRGLALLELKNEIAQLRDRE